MTEHWDFVLPRGYEGITPTLVLTWYVFTAAKMSLASASHWHLWHRYLSQWDAYRGGEWKMLDFVISCQFLRSLPHMCTHSLALLPTPRAHSHTYARSFPHEPAHSRTFPHTPAHSGMCWCTHIDGRMTKAKMPSTMVTISYPGPHTAALVLV